MSGTPREVGAGRVSSQVLLWPCPNGLAVQMVTSCWGTLEDVSQGTVPWKEEALLQGGLIRHPSISPSPAPMVYFTTSLHCCLSATHLLGVMKRWLQIRPPLSNRPTQKLKNLLCAESGLGVAPLPLHLSPITFTCAEVSATRTTHAWSCQAQRASTSSFQVTSLLGPSHLAVGRKEHPLPTS